MKIGINAQFFQHPSTGSGQYILHLLAAIGEIDQQNEYILFGSRPVTNGSVATTPYPYRVRPVPGIAAMNKSIEKTVWEQLTGPASTRKVRADIFHVPYFAPPLFPRTPTVVTIHDVIPLRLPAYHSSAKVKAYLNLVSRAAHKATMVITISQHAKQDIMDALKLPAERIRVIYQAAGKEYRPITSMEVQDKICTRYGISKRYIFYLGGMDQRKNVPQLIRAFAKVYKEVGDPDLQLFISANPDKLKGPLFPDPRPVATELGIADQIIYGFVEDEDKPAAYSGASLFVFPSLYEGFGLDPLEAMSCGAPVVCSNRTSLPEVVGDAALTVDPEDTRALADAMIRVLTNNDLAADLRRRSLQQAKLFSWRKTAEETVSVYEEVLAMSQ